MPTRCGAARHMMGAFGAISSLSERLGLKDNIKHRACELYKEVGASRARRCPLRLMWPDLI